MRRVCLIGSSNLCLVSQPLSLTVCKLLLHAQLRGNVKAVERGSHCIYVFVCACVLVLPVDLNHPCHVFHLPSSNERSSSSALTLHSYLKLRQ